jgi:hypothetical protein
MMGEFDPDAVSKVVQRCQQALAYRTAVSLNASELEILASFSKEYAERTETINDEPEFCALVAKLRNG